MAAMTDLDEMLRTLTVSVRPQRYTFITVETGTAPPLGEGVEAVIREDKADTIVATVERAAAEGWPHHFVAAWLTLDVHSALEAVGLTAAFSAALGMRPGSRATYLRRTTTTTCSYRPTEPTKRSPHSNHSGPFSPRQPNSFGHVEGVRPLRRVRYRLAGQAAAGVSLRLRNDARTS